MAARQGLGHQMRLIARVQLVAKILDVSLDRPWCDSELLRTLLGGESAGNALQDFSLPVGQGDKIFLLPRKIHHASPYWETIRVHTNNLSYHCLTAY